MVGVENSFSDTHAAFTEGVSARGDKLGRDPCRPIVDINGRLSLENDFQENKLWIQIQTAASDWPLRPPISFFYAPS